MTEGIEKNIQKSPMDTDTNLQEENSRTSAKFAEGVVRVKHALNVMTTVRSKKNYGQ